MNLAVSLSQTMRAPDFSSKPHIYSGFACLLSGFVILVILCAPVRTARALPIPGITATPTAPDLSENICSPLAQNPLSDLPKIVSDPYRPPPPGHEERHHGVDFNYYRRKGRLSIKGEGVQAVLGGRVAAAISDKYPYGNLIIIETSSPALPEQWIKDLKMKSGESIYTLYAHLEDAPKLKPGEAVTRCQQINTVGMTGNAIMPHLHLEMRIGPAGFTFTSMSYYDLKATLQEKQTYKLWRTSGKFRHFNPMDLLFQKQVFIFAYVS